MKEQKISWETGILAKEIGFPQGGPELLLDNPEIECYYTDEIIRPYFFNPYEHVCVLPNQALLQKWFREVHDIDCESYLNAWIGTSYTKRYKYRVIKEFKETISDPEFFSSEDALEAGLQRVCKLLK